MTHLIPLTCTVLAGVAMVKLGVAKNMLVVRKRSRCAACGLEPRACRCAE